MDSGCPSGSPSGSGGPSPGPPGSPLQLPPVLLEAQVAKLAEAAQLLVNTLPQMEPKSHTAKKKMNKDLEVFSSYFYFNFLVFFKSKSVVFNLKWQKLSI